MPGVHCLGNSAIYCNIEMGSALTHNARKQMSAIGGKRVMTDGKLDAILHAPSRDSINKVKVIFIFTVALWDLFCWSYVPLKSISAYYFVYYYTAGRFLSQSVDLSA